MADKYADGAFWTLATPLGEPLALTTTSADVDRQAVLLQINRLGADRRPVPAGLAVYRLSALTARNLGTSLLNAAKAIDAVAGSSDLNVLEPPSGS